MISRAHSFRAWLLERLRGTAWATGTYRDDRIDEVAKSLGVQPDLLLEARALVAIEQKSRGLPPPERYYYQFDIKVPRGLWATWLEECHYRGTPGALLLRSLVHDYLLHAREPAPLAIWYFGGRQYPIKDSLRERATLPHGAYRALARRAQIIGSNATAVVRALMVEAMTGLHRQIFLVETRAMFDDESRYFEAEAKDRLTRDEGAG